MEPHLSHADAETGDLFAPALLLDGRLSCWGRIDQGVPNEHVPCAATTEHSHAHARHVQSTDQTESHSTPHPRTHNEEDLKNNLPFRFEDLFSSNHHHEHFPSSVRWRPRRSHRINIQDQIVIHMIRM
jgi:hypothetical protein